MKHAIRRRRMLRALGRNRLRNPLRVGWCIRFHVDVPIAIGWDVRYSTFAQPFYRIPNSREQWVFLASAPIRLATRLPLVSQISRG